jgi:hypothetical protein
MIKLMIHTTRDVWYATAIIGVIYLISYLVFEVWRLA